MLCPTMKILEKNLLILASAGSGKTFQLGNRVIGLVARGVAPERIVALTFTRKAAGEFADSVLMKLAEAASVPAAAAKLRDELAMPDADFAEALERVVRALPKLTFGTMDGFFSKVVRGFQYELGLTGGKFDLLEGPRAEAAADEILAMILGDALDGRGGEDFMHAFRHATIGNEGQKVQENLRKFIKQWHGRYQESRLLRWGPPELAGVNVEEWEKQKHGLGTRVLRGLDSTDYTRKDQREALEKAVSALLNHTIGSGSLGSAKGVLESALSACSSASCAGGPMDLKFHKTFVFSGPPCDALREMICLAARCEFAAALLRTRAVREVVSVYDAICEKKLRRRGLLGFNDVKLLMGRWVTSSDAEILRSEVDFRLDARYDHWLLDEFQDTSRSDWMGLQPLIDEAAMKGEGSMFIVGDRKQAIYAWRGGDVTLFDEVITRYGGAGLKTAPLTESWRSCPEVLALVNQVCGDVSKLRELFGPVAERWDWQGHTSAAPLQSAAKRGEARVEVVEGKWEERLARLVELLAELGAGQRAMTCGVLVRDNATVREISDALRAAGLDVIEEGRREPSKDHPVGIALGHLLNWLAVPADAFAWEVVEMSPLAAGLRARFGTHWQQIWEGLLGRASEVGFAGMIEEVVECCWSDWSDFGRRRSGDIITALANLDAQGCVTAREAAEWIERLEVSQNPGIAAVQVMTIHKAKGLGFDMVVLPDIPNTTIPASQHFDVAEGDGWLSQTPPKWAREILPEMEGPTANWSSGQCYEAFCMLYVGLTRSKRGLYVLLEPPAKKQADDKRSLANWLAGSANSNGEAGIVYQSGTQDWADNVALMSKKAQPGEKIVLGASEARRKRTTPSGIKAASGAVPHSRAGMLFGNAVHAAFVQIGWIDEISPKFPDSDAGRVIRKLLESPRIRALFERCGRSVELFREQPIDATVDGKWLSGTIDRLHLQRDAAGKVTQIEVIDFKTDAVSDVHELAARYSGQMASYREAIGRAHPDASVACILISTKCGDCITV